MVIIIYLISLRFPGFDLTSHGGCILIGTATEQDGDMRYYYDYITIFLILNSNGNEQWRQYFGGLSADHFSVIKRFHQLSDGNGKYGGGYLYQFR